MMDSPPSHIRDLLRDLGVSWKEFGETPKATQGRLTIDCPYCGKPGKPGMGIHVQTLRTSCWSCGPHDLAEVLVEITGRPFRDIYRLLASVDSDSTRSSFVRETGSYTPPQGLVELKEPCAQRHRRYLQQRRFDPVAVAGIWGVQALADPAITSVWREKSTTSISIRWRLFIPITAPGVPGKRAPASWTTRAIGSCEPRYLSAPPSCEALPIKEMLYGLNQVRHCVVLVEGPTDVWRIGPGAVASFGLALTTPQVLALSRIPVRAVLFDNEPQAQRQARKLADILSVFPGETYVISTSGSDPADSPEEEIREIQKRFFD